MKVNYMKPPKQFKINSTEWWVKPVDMLCHNWALIESYSIGVSTVYFFHDQGTTKGGSEIRNPFRQFKQSNGYIAVVDSLEFDSLAKAKAGLLSNRFKMLSKYPGPWTGCEPIGQYFDARKYETGIYSNGEYWQS